MTCTDYHHWNSKCTFSCLYATSTLTGISDTITCEGTTAIGTWNPSPPNCLFLPEPCTDTESGHSVECLISIWTISGCLVEGNLSPSEASQNLMTSYAIMTTRELLRAFKPSHERARNGEEQSQLDCYGIVVPDVCSDPKKGHSAECMDVIWIKSGCIKQGHELPSKLNSQQQSTLSNIPLRKMLDQFKDIQTNAVNGNVQSQSECYGLVFPSGCATYNGPHSTSCLETIWKSKKCVSEGDSYPSKLSPHDFNSLKNRDLRSILSEFESLSTSASNGDATAQKKCFGSAFPEGCANYYGPHSTHCLKTIWASAGCSKQGTKYPLSVSAQELNEVKNLNIREVGDRYQNYKHQADNNNKQHQLFCFGLEYPSNCAKYNGPHSTQCLETMWISAQCLPAGSKFPSKLSGSELEQLRTSTISEIQAKFKSTKESADSGNTQSQQYCFGIVYPSSCNKYYGPYSAECLKSIWKIVKCLPEGTEYPPKLSQAQLSAFNGKGISVLQNQFNNIALAADQGDSSAQEKCHGIVYPQHCTKYSGPHSVNCLKTIWTKVGCLEKGSKHPDKLSPAEKNRLNSLTLRELEREFQTVKDSADNGNKADQNSCFGMEYPTGCSKYFGPHSISCLETIWKTVQCLPEGQKYPQKLSSTELNDLNKKNIREVTSRFQGMKDSADSGDGTNQLFCFGKKYPANCNEYYGPYTAECLDTIWKLVKCLPEGTNHPSKRSQSDIAGLTGLGLNKLIEQTKGIADAADSGDITAQKNCYGIEYPLHCTKYYGPHSKDCLKTIWSSAECLKEGTKYPPVLPAAELNRISNINLREVIAEFQNIKQKADSNDKAHQKYCFGTEYPTHCSKYYGPHSMECLNTMWISAQCLAEGTKYPEKLSSAEKQRLDDMDIRAIIKEFNDLKASSDSGNKDSQTFCFGLTYPTNCNKYFGPHPVTCLVTIWISVQCLHEGTKYPEKLGSAEKSRLDSMTIRQVTDEFSGIKNSADSGDASNQNFCFGIEYPNHCVKYYGPHPVECLTTIWKSAKCLEDGTKYPTKITPQELQQFNGMDLRRFLFEKFDSCGLGHRSLNEDLICLL
ncbi:uncharacterized protein LOC120346548 [Styela clava]